MSYPIHSLNRPSVSGAVRTEVGFWGLDPSRNAADRVSERAIDTENLIWKGDALGRRSGYRRICSLSDPIYGIYFYKEELLVHAGIYLYRIADTDAEPEILMNKMNPAPSKGLVRHQAMTIRQLSGPNLYDWYRQRQEKDILFICDGKNFWFYDGEIAHSVVDECWNYYLKDEMDGHNVTPTFYATVPFTTVAKSPMGNVGDTDPRGDNRLSQFRCESFYVNETGSNRFELNVSQMEINTGYPIEIQLRDSQGKWYTFICMDEERYADDSWTAVVVLDHTFAAGAAFDINGLDQIVDWGEGDLTIANDGSDNLRITYAVNKNYPDELVGATAMGVFGADGADNVLFLGGSEKSPGVDYFSAAEDFTCFYQASKEILGSNVSPVTGYCRLSDGRMAVLKNDPEGANVYFRNHAVLSMGRTQSGDPYQVDLFPSCSGAAVEGCISARTVGTVGNEPIFLTDAGLYSVKSVSDTLVNMNQTIHRSAAVDSYLRQVDRSTLLSICWENYYLLCFGREALITDGKRDRTGALRFLKWRFSHPISALAKYDGTLWLGDQNGGIYCLGDSADDAGVPFSAFWQAALPEEKSGRRMNLKRLWAAFSPDYQGAADAVVYHGRCPAAPMKLPLRRIDFSNWDFSAITFDGTNAPRWLSILPAPASADSFMVQVRFDAGQDLLLWGFRMLYEKGGMMV